MTANASVTGIKGSLIKSFFPGIAHRHRPKDVEDEDEDELAKQLSHVSAAMLRVLKKKHHHYHHTLWGVTSGRVVGELYQTPTNGWNLNGDPDPCHSDWYPEKLREIISRTEIWCDIISLSHPKGRFMEEIKKGLYIVAEKSKSREKPVIVRIMLGDIIGKPANCSMIIKKLTEDLPRGANMHLWVGAWRIGVSWNHAKIIAVDGKYLHTGGHNMWDLHYLKKNPVYDLSVEMEGRIAIDGHIYANMQWSFIKKKSRSFFHCKMQKLPREITVLSDTRVIIHRYPKNKADKFPPKYVKSLVPKCPLAKDRVPVLSIGRYGRLVMRKRPSNDAFVEMFLSAKDTIRLAIQDLGPMCLPQTKIALPGLVWPKAYLRALGHVLWVKDVRIDIALCNPRSVPGGLSSKDTNYGNGWSCADVASEIIKTIKKQFPAVGFNDLKEKVASNLRVCYVKNKKGKAWEDGSTLAMHAKHFIIDDVCAYIGSQNLYVCDLAEWGVVIDDPAQTKKILDEYWKPMWTSSYTQVECGVSAIMEGLSINRDGKNWLIARVKNRKELKGSVHLSCCNAEPIVDS